MKTIIVALRWNDEKLGSEWLNLDNLKALIYEDQHTSSKLLKIARYWEPEMERVCKCGRKGYHIEWSPDEGEEWSCCDCWVAKGNAPAAHHARLRMTDKEIAKREIEEYVNETLKDTKDNCPVAREFRAIIEGCINWLDQQE